MCCIGRVNNNLILTPEIVYDLKLTRSRVQIRETASTKGTSFRVVKSITSRSVAEVVRIVKNKNDTVQIEFVVLCGCITWLELTNTRVTFNDIHTQSGYKFHWK